MTAGDWQPMESAPKDGRRILASTTSSYRSVLIVRWDDPDMSGFGEMHWVTDGNGPVEFGGTRILAWMELPGIVAPIVPGGEK